MENTFYTWLHTLTSIDYTVRINAQERSASARYGRDEALRIYPSIQRAITAQWVGSIVVTASCGCSYHFERFDHYADNLCDAHWVRAMLSGAVNG
ncbi:hypothetical protein UFOVP698_38 [uncultured Caudovirales phage]|uniref:Uncharacterized protein n=1 Tax=uncultured Caudovirales phage TaxID=2100421 RepID=A0A6J5NJH2_9CAUD|nr:hypothetical protein UFOVP698_38 [uncultured Caudovirales phage]